MKKKFNLYLLLTLVTFTFITVIGILYSTNPILDQHSFRQTQTAISAKYIFDGNIFNYQTPILGEPYNIPFEFPIYQILVAFIYWKGFVTIKALRRKFIERAKLKCFAIY